MHKIVVLKSGINVALAGVLVCCSALAVAQTAQQNPLLYEVLDRLEILERELRQLRGDLDRLQYQLGQSGQAGAATRRSEPALVPLPPQDSDVRGLADSNSSAAIVFGQPSAAEEESYELAFSRLREGQYQQAAAQFETFVNAYPRSSLTADAYYWLGESHYVNRDFEPAKQAFLTLGSRYPRSSKLPDALLKLGYIYSELGDTAKARQVLQKLITTFPQDHAAALAERQLRSLR